MNYWEVFHHKKPVIAMLHLKENVNISMLERAKQETDAYIAAGVDAVLVENYFGSVSDCETVLSWLQQERPHILYGVNVLGDYHRAFALSRKYGARFIQIDSVCGHLPGESDLFFAKELNAERQNCDAVVLGGVRFKYQPIRSGRTVEEDLRLGMTRCDAIVVTGSGTGVATPQDKVREFRTILGDFPLITGAGVTKATAEETFRESDGAIVGSYFKVGHRDYGDVYSPYVEEFMREVQKGRN